MLVSSRVFFYLGRLHQAGHRLHNLITCVFVFQTAKKRSKTCILVKNLPANTETEELKSLFVKHGHIARFLMPKHGITALVDFIEPFEAKKAFSKLAYSQFKHVPLYLEWAPENVFLKSAEKIEPSSETNSRMEENTKAREYDEPSKQSESKEAIKSVDKEPVDENEEAEEPENDTTLFVKNLNFRTTDAELKSVNGNSVSYLYK